MNKVANKPKPAEPVIKPVIKPEVIPDTPWIVPGPKVNPKPKGKSTLFSGS